MRNVSKVLVGVGSLMAVTAANAAVDVTAATTALSTDAGGAITAIGSAMLLLAGIAVAFKWAKAAFFG